MLQGHWKPSEKSSAWPSETQKTRQLNNRRNRKDILIRESDNGFFLKKTPESCKTREKAQKSPLGH
jgi:hypothetical protein